jgi:invasion protein IalB
MILSPKFPLIALAAALVAALAGAPARLSAQEATQPAAGAGTDATGGTGSGTAATAPDPNAPSLGTPVSEGPGSEYVKESFDAWDLRCIRSQDGKDPCQLYQLLKDAQGGGVAEISIIPLPPGGKAVAGATIVTPLETLLTEQVTLGLDGAEAKKYPFTFCTAAGCVARVGFTADEIAAFKKGAKAVMTIVPLAAPDQKVNLDVSLKGFTAGFDAVSKVTGAAEAPKQ